MAVTTTLIPEPSVTQLGYVIFGVSDLDGWRDFAVNVLGLQVNGTGPSGELYLRLDDYHHRFILTPTGEDDLTLAGFEVKDADALDRVSDRLRALNIEVSEGTSSEAEARMVMGLAKYRDPDGVAGELYYGPLLERRPFVSTRVTSGFLGADLGFGHIVRSVDDEDAYLKYLIDGLGARVSDYILLGAGSQKAVFLHVNPRHHSVAIVQRRITAAKNPERKRLEHFMVEVNSIDDVGFAREAMLLHGLPTGQIGKHPNDWMVSVYCMTPSGFEIEYGTAGRLIRDESEWEVSHYRTTSTWGHGPLCSS